jgi:hypothetical protein
VGATEGGAVKIWERAFIESHLMSPHGPQRIAACRTAYNYGFTIDEIVETSGLPKWRVLQAVLGEAVSRTTDD